MVCPKHRATVLLRRVSEDGTVYYFCRYCNKNIYQEKDGVITKL